MPSVTGHDMVKVYTYVLVYMNYCLNNSMSSVCLVMTINVVRSEINDIFKSYCIIRGSETLSRETNLSKIVFTYC